MRLQAYLTQSSALRRFQICFLALALAVVGACGGDDDDDTAALPGKRHDGGSDRDAGDAGDDEDLDANYPVPITIDAGKEIPGDPPKELADQSCAVDTNKLYDLITYDRQPEPTRLGVDVVASHFAIAYVDKSKECIDAVYVAELDGESRAEPKVALAVDPCSIVDRAAIEHDGKHWMLGTIDAREDGRDLWVQEVDIGSKKAYPAHNVTESDAAEREFALLSLGEDGMLAVWAEDDAIVDQAARLKTRMLSASGEPDGDAIELEQPDKVVWAFSSISLVAIGTEYIGLVYRRSDNTGRAELVLDVLSRKGERDRDPWILSDMAGGYGSIDVAGDEKGGGVIYSLFDGEFEQLWFQGLGADGAAVRVTSADKTGGPAEPRRIVAPPFKATDASLARLPNGYAVAYRALPGGDVTSPRIRAHFLDSFGRILDKSDVALAEPSGGRTAIEVAYDGRVVVGWSDSTAEGKTTLTAIKLPCVGGP